MRCDHTSYEMRDAGLFCRTCGMSSTEVYYEARKGDVLHPSIVHGVKVFRPQSEVMLGVYTADPYAMSFPQPRIAIPSPMPERKTSPAWVYVALWIIFPTATFVGLALHLLPVFLAGGAAFLYLCTLAIMDSRLFGIAETAREEMKALRSPPKAENRTGAITVYGFGGRDLRAWTQ